MGRRTTKQRSTDSSPLATLRRRAQGMMDQVRRMGMQQVRALEQQIHRLDQRRQALLAEIGIGTAPKGRRTRTAVSRAGGQSGRVDWSTVFKKLPKTSFQAASVKKLVPHVSSGTVSLRLSSWVRQKKLRRTGTRRSARYTRVA